MTILILLLFYLSTFSTNVVISKVGGSVLLLFSLFSHPFCLVFCLICEIVINYIGLAVLANVFGERTSNG